MLILLFLLSQGWVYGYSHYRTPTATAEILGVRDTIDCSCPDKRSTLDIVWSSLATIFLCTWVCIHPNLPPPGEGRLKGALRRLYIMGWALLTPEAILLWSFRQWHAARDLTRIFKDRNWTMKHSFFVIMGGFVLYKGEEDIGGTISYHDFLRLEKDGDIEFPKITGEEIDDRSKGDAVSKAITILQTTWFIIQCIGRGAQGLAITELEIGTVALCSLNAIIYFFWWHKPLDIKCRVPLYLKNDSDYAVIEESLQPPTDAEASGPANAAVRQELQGESENKNYEQRRTATLSRLIRHQVLSSGGLGSEIYKSYNQFKSEMKRHPSDAGCRSFLFVVLKIPFRALILFAETLFNIFGYTVLIPFFWIWTGSSVEDGFLDESLRPPSIRSHLPTFYSPCRDVEEEESAELLLTAILYSISAALVGGLHCILWDSEFPTNAELLIWRISSLLITTIPISILLVFLLYSFSYKHFMGMDDEEDGIVPNICAATTMLLIFWYPIARLLLFLECFISLRALPSSALIDINWSNFIPHF
ncbi:hypothetical protein CPC08DRAFT_646337 [Agrocybe pediades]|nr:hypothetical protein CPC08DRAFT_646337 [Agrocybe pediades]